MQKAGDSQILKQLRVYSLQVNNYFYTTNNLVILDTDGIKI
jgi:hypothetical protein